MVFRNTGLFNCMSCSDPNGIRTRAAAVKGRCPRPLNDGAGGLAGAGPPTAKHTEHFPSWQNERSGCPGTGHGASATRPRQCPESMRRAPIVKAANARVRVRSGGSSRPRGRGTMDRTTVSTAPSRRPNEPSPSGRTRAIRASAGRRVRDRRDRAHRGRSSSRRRSRPSPPTTPHGRKCRPRKADTAAGAAAVKQITALIAELAANVEATRLEAERRTEELFVAQQKYDDAVQRAATIQAEADASAAEAAEAERNAGQVAAQLYRSGGSDLGVNLFLEAGNSGSTDVLLSKLGNMSKMVERTSGIYEAAQEKGNSAQSLSDQAAVARGERREAAGRRRRGARCRAGGAGRGRGGARRVRGEEDRARRAVEVPEGRRGQDGCGVPGGRAHPQGRGGAPPQRGGASPPGGDQGGLAGRGRGLGLVEAGVGLDLGQLRPAPGDLRRRVLLEQLPLRHRPRGTGCGAPIYAANSGVVTYAG